MRACRIAGRSTCQQADRSVVNTELLVLVSLRYREEMLHSL